MTEHRLSVGKQGFKSQQGGLLGLACAFLISASLSYHLLVQAFVSVSAAVFGSEGWDPPFELCVRLCFLQIRVTFTAWFKNETTP